MIRYVSISTYAKMVGISRPAVYKRLKKGHAVLLADCEVPVIDLTQSRGNRKRSDWSKLKDAMVYKVDRQTGRVVVKPYFKAATQPATQSVPPLQKLSTLTALNRF